MSSAFLFSFFQDYLGDMKCTTCLLAIMSWLRCSCRKETGFFRPHVEHTSLLFAIQILFRCFCREEKGLFSPHVDYATLFLTIIDDLVSAQVLLPQGERLFKAACSAYHSVVDDFVSAQVLLPQGDRPIQAACGAYHSFVVTASGGLYAAGWNLCGQLGYASP